MRPTLLCTLTLLLSGLTAARHVRPDAGSEPGRGRRGVSLDNILHDLDLAGLGNFGLQTGEQRVSALHPLDRRATADKDKDKKKDDKSKPKKPKKHTHKHKHHHHKTTAAPAKATAAKSTGTTTPAEKATAAAAAATAAKASSSAPTQAELNAEKDEKTLAEVKNNLVTLESSFNNYVHAASTLMDKACKAVDMAPMGISVAECNQTEALQKQLVADLRTTLSTASVPGTVQSS